MGIGGPKPLQISQPRGNVLRINVGQTNSGPKGQQISTSPICWSVGPTLGWMIELRDGCFPIPRANALGWVIEATSGQCSAHLPRIVGRSVICVGTCGRRFAYGPVEQLADPAQIAAALGELNEARGDGTEIVF